MTTLISKIKYWLEDHHVYGHSSHESGYHRFWQHIGPICLHLEMGRGSREYSTIDLQLGGEGRELGLIAQLQGVLFLSAAIEHLFPWRWDPGLWPLRTGFTIYENDRLSLYILHRDVSDREGWSISWSLKDWLFGRQQYACNIIDQHRVELRLPERLYLAQVEESLGIWTRPRWPWPTVAHRFDFTLIPPVPFPGKGENDWDQGEDAMHSIMVRANDLGQATCKVLESIYRTRKERA